MIIFFAIARIKEHPFPSSVLLVLPRALHWRADDSHTDPHIRWLVIHRLIDKSSRIQQLLIFRIVIKVDHS